MGHGNAWDHCHGDISLGSWGFKKLNCRVSSIHVSLRSGSSMQRVLCFVRGGLPFEVNHN